MARGRKRFDCLCGILIMSIAAGLYGCAPATVSASEPHQLTPCSLADPQVNIYKAPPPTLANIIFQYAATPIPPNTVPLEQQIIDARYAAFEHLTSATKRWSHVETITLSDATEIQIAVIFISPELIEAVYLNEILKYPAIIGDFENHMQSLLNVIAEREELLFLVVVTSAKDEYSSIDIAHVIDLPITSMVLVNAENISIPPKHDDHVLDQPIYISSGPVFGYIAYPMAVHIDNGCKWILDPKYNMSIVLDVPNIQIDGVTSGPRTWSIPYVPLLSPPVPQSTPVFPMPSNFDRTRLSYLNKPPTPAINLNPASDTDSISFWQEMARFLWGQILLISS